MRSTREGRPFRASNNGGYWLTQGTSSDNSPRCLWIWKWFNEGSPHDGRGTAVKLSMSTETLFFDSQECDAVEQAFRNGG